MTTVGTGKHIYELIEDWAKLPPGESFGMVSAITTDDQDRVFAFQRKDPPVLIFDPEVTYRVPGATGPSSSPTVFTSRTTSCTSPIAIPQSASCTP